MLLKIVVSLLVLFVSISLPQPVHANTDTAKLLRGLVNKPKQSVDKELKKIHAVLKSKDTSGNEVEYKYSLRGEELVLFYDKWESNPLLMNFFYMPRSDVFKSYLSRFGKYTQVLDVSLKQPISCSKAYWESYSEDENDLLVYCSNNAPHKVLLVTSMATFGSESDYLVRASKMP